MTPGLFYDDAILRRDGLSRAERDVLAVVANYAKRSGLAYASVGTYARRIRMSDRYTRAILRRLEAKGLIVAVGDKAGGNRRTVPYRVVLDSDGHGTQTNSEGEQTDALPGTGAPGNPEQSGSQPGSSVPPKLKDIRPSREEERQPRSTEALGPSSHEDTNAADMDRLVAFAFRGGASPNQRRAVINAGAEAIRLGATCHLLAHAVISPKAKGQKPWERIEEAGRRTKDLLDRTRAALQDFSGMSLTELLTVTAPRGQLRTDDLVKEHKKLFGELDAWRQQATIWPETQ